jgi:hypothetical protein
MPCQISLKAAVAVAAAVSCLLTLTVHPCAAKTVIVTEEEAKLPPPKEMPPPDRGITRGPKIELVEDGKTALHSPMHLKLKFKTFGGSAIDLGAFQATYVKNPTVDLTSRIRPFTQPSGIDIPDAELPPGEHFIQFGIKDSEGRAVSKIFKFKIMP